MPSNKQPPRFRSKSKSPGVSLACRGTLCLTLATLSVLPAPQAYAQASIGRHYAPPIVLLSEEEGHSPSQMSFADLNGDGKEDAFYSNLDREDFRFFAPLVIWLANDEGSFDLVTEDIIEGEIPGEEQGFRQHIPADFNGDGRVDLFLEASGPEPDCDDPPGAHNTCFPGGRNQLLLSGEDGKLHNVSATHLPNLKDFSHGSAVGDFDGDGDLDIWVNNSGAPLGDVQFAYLLYNDGNGHFEIVADFSTEGDPDRITGPNGIFPDPGTYWGVGLWSVAIDADGDGDLDLALDNAQIDQGGPEPDFFNLLFLNDGSGVFSVEFDSAWPNPEGFPPEAPAQDAIIEDLNDDGLDDLLLHKSGPGFVDSLFQALISNGDGTFRDETPARAPRNPIAISVSLDKGQLRDFDGDGHPDLINWIYYPSDGYPFYVEIMINDGEGFFRPLATDFINDVINHTWVAIDVDGDGGTDFFEGNILHKMIEPYGAELDGTDDDDRLIGGDWNNVYRGLEGDDVLDGGLGNDRLDGGPGNDVLIGGKGADHYIYHSADLADNDTINDKAGGADRLQFEDFDLSAVTQASQGPDAELVLTFAAGGSITVQNHFLGGTSGIEKLEAGGTVHDLSQDPSFQNGTIEDLIDGVQEGFLMDAGLNGNWWNGPARDGEGAQIEIADADGGNQVFVATIYSYGTMGNQIFLVAVGNVDGDTAEVDLFITDGGAWGAGFDPALVQETQWGSGAFTANNCSSIHMELRPNAEYQALGYTDLSYDLIRLTTPIISCPFESPD